MIISPPLTLTTDEIDILITRVRKSLDQTYAELQAQDMLKAAS
jgi:putrescine aminotransferase